MRSTAISVTLLAFLAGSAGASPAYLDASTLRGILLSRRADYTGTLDARLRREARALDAAVGRLDSPSASLEDDLAIARVVVRGLEKPFRRDVALIAALEALVDEGAGYVRAARDGLESLAAASLANPGVSAAYRASIRAERRLDDSDRAPTLSTRARLLEQALAAVRAGVAALEAGAGGEGGGGDGGGSGDPEPRLATASVEVTHILAEIPDGPWVADDATARVVLGPGDVPVSLEIKMVQAPAGSAVVTSWMTIQVSSDWPSGTPGGFTGVGTYGAFYLRWEPIASDPRYYLVANEQWGANRLTVTDFDVAGSRIAGTFEGVCVGTMYRMGGTWKDGKFDIRGVAFIRQP